MVQNSTQEKSPRYFGLVEFFHPRIHGCNATNYKELLNHYIVFCSKNFLLNESDCEDEYSSAGEYDDPADAPYSDNDSDTEYVTESETDSETDSDSDFDSETNTITLINYNQNSNITNYAIINEFKYLQGTRIMCINAYNSIEINSGKPLTLKAIKNYQNIIKSSKYLQPEIFEKVYVHDRCCAIIKTFWIKIVQRSWKRVFKERTRIRALRRSVKAILYWQMFGKWPEYCAYMPGLRHMII
jgi:hypothetical protein